MKYIKLNRFVTNDEGTLGVLLYNKQLVCNTLELPARNNKRSLSRITGGVYNCFYMERSSSGKYKQVYHVQNVVDRSGILIHSGNYAGDKLKGFKTHSLGCILPCIKFGKLGGQLAGLQSRKAMEKLRDFIYKDNFILEVNND